MVEGTVPVDVLNPGQVFACIGFLEAAEVLLGEVEGVFDWSNSSDARFRLRTAGKQCPIERVLQFLAKASASARAPVGSAACNDWTQSWGPVPSTVERARGYPFPDPPSPATLVCVLSDGRHEIPIDHWGDTPGRDNVKFWAGAGGYPGATRARDALALIAGRAGNAVRDPFALSAPQSSSFGLDWRRDYIPIDTGFSLNNHDHIKSVGFPLVELLAAIGLTHARPSRPDQRNKLEYIYGIAGRARASERTWLRPTLLRAALGATTLPFPMRRFHMQLDWSGKAGQMRAITTVTEESFE